MSVKIRKTLQVVSGWDAVEIFFMCLFLGLWQLVKISFIRLWKGHRRKSYNEESIELSEDSSVGTHYYIKIMGVKYHYVEAGPKSGQVVLVLGDAPDSNLFSTPSWSLILQQLTETHHRVITLDLRGCGGSERGSRVDLSPPQAVDELSTLLKALGVSESHPAVVIGNGIGGMLAWYLSHCQPRLVGKLVVIDSPHPNLYWQHPPAEFCNNSLHFIQWPYLPERWLAERAGSAGSAGGRGWAASRAHDWSGPLNYVRGAAWWRINPSSRVLPPALLVGRAEAGAGGSAAQLVASAEKCDLPTLRIVSADTELPVILADYLIARVSEADEPRPSYRSGLVTRVWGAVASTGRLSTRISLAKLMPQPA